MAFPFSRLLHSRVIGFVGNTTATTFSLDAAYVHYTSGKAMALGLIAPVTQSNGTLTVYLYCSAVTGAPTDVRCALYDGPSGSMDADRPTSNAATATSAAVDCSASAGHWVEFSLTGVSLTVGQTYYLIFDNRTASPDANYPTFQLRSVVPGGTWVNSSALQKALFSCTTTVGFSADATYAVGTPAAVVVFDGGEIIGNPFVKTDTHASDTADRGLRFTPTENLTISGFVTELASGTIALTGKVYASTGGAALASVTADRGNSVSSGQGYTGTLFRFAPITLVGGTTYDLVVSVASATALASIATMGEASPPAAVQACVWPGLAYVTGTTPGSYTADATKVFRMAVIVDDNPAVSSATLPDAKYVYGGVDRGDGVTGTLRASTISVAAGAGSNLSAGLLKSGEVVDDVTGTYGGGSGGGFPVLGGSVVR